LPQVRSFIMNPVLSTYSVHTYLSSTYSVRTWGEKYVPVCTLHKKYVLKRSGTRRYNTIAWYEVVRTGLYRVRTTVHDSRCPPCLTVNFKGQLLNRLHAAGPAFSSSMTRSGRSAPPLPRLSAQH
jgi:hypothetical protein